MHTTSIPEVETMAATCNTATPIGKRTGIILAVLTTLVNLPLLPASLVIAGFTLWGIGENNYPPPFMEDPMEWVWSFFALLLPLATIITIIGTWLCYWRKKYSRLKKYVVFGTIWTLLSLRNVAIVMGLI